MTNLTVYFTEFRHAGFIRLNYDTTYAAGSIPISNTAALIEEINALCGAGSYCRYSKTERQPNGERVVKGDGRLGYIQQGFKTKVLEEAYTAAKNSIKDFNYPSITEWVEEFYDWAD